MTDFEKDMENLGDTIEAIIDNAINSGDFRRMSSSIRSTVRKAVDTGSREASRAADRFRPQESDRSRSRKGYQSNKNIYSSRIHYDNVPDDQQPYAQQVPAAYKKNVDASDNSTGLIIGGGILTAIFGQPALLALQFGKLSLAALLGLGAGIVMLVKGIQKKKLKRCYKKYLKQIAGKQVIELKMLASLVGEDVNRVRYNIKEMIAKDLFPQGHLDDTETSLILTDEAYSHYLELKERRDFEARKEAADREVEELEKAREQALREQEETMQTIRRQKQEQKEKVDAEVQEMLDRGAAFVRQIRACNQAIPGEEITRKISRMEEVVAKILARAESHPEIAPKLKKLMDYYLPMTIKLLNAYADMDAQPIQGGNITRSKKEIEATLDTLNDAFEKLLDSIFQDTAMDVSSDISVLQALLAQEGLTNDEFQAMTK